MYSYTLRKEQMSPAGAYIIETTDGILVDGGGDPGKSPKYQQREAAEQSVKGRNAEAERLGIKARYRVREDD